MTPLLDVRDLRVSFRTESGLVRAVDGVSFTLEAGHVLGIVGESGSGKSVSVMSIMQLIRDPNAIFEGQVLYKGRDLMGLSQRDMRSVRGAEIAMIFQDPMTSLNPVYRVGWQIEEQLHAHEKLARRAARTRAIELLGAVGIPSAARRIDDYPHQFSGGMRQRVMIAIALACNPDLLIADEPTTALDVTIQAQILTLIERLKAEFGSAVILITHDMGVVAQIAETVAVMYGGKIVEQGGVDAVFASPQHPYTLGLLNAVPRLTDRGDRPLRTIEGLPPLLIDPPNACAFAGRCPFVMRICRQQDPGYFSPVPDNRVACWLHHEQAAARRESFVAARKTA
ncbi:MAG TPA: ABC transporter ATP-binding protein [Solirubrobacteraceae bacterium]